MCIRDSDKVELWGKFEDFNGLGQISPDSLVLNKVDDVLISPKLVTKFEEEDEGNLIKLCLLYTSDAADERSSVDLGGRRIIKKKNKHKIRERNTYKKTIKNE